MFLRILHLFAVGLITCTAVARSLCVSWAFLLQRCKVRDAHTGVVGRDSGTPFPTF